MASDPTPNDRDREVAFAKAWSDFTPPGINHAFFEHKVYFKAGFDAAYAYRAEIEAAADAVIPKVNIRCETADGSLKGVLYLNVLRVEREDDGTYTAVTDHWPNDCAAAEQRGRAEAVKGLRHALNAANMAMFVILKQGVMPNSSWESGIQQDIATGEAVLDAIESREIGCGE